MIKSIKQFFNVFSYLVIAYILYYLIRDIFFLNNDFFTSITNILNRDIPIPFTIITAISLLICSYSSDIKNGEIANNLKKQLNELLNVYENFLIEIKNDELFINGILREEANYKINDIFKYYLITLDIKYLKRQSIITIVNNKIKELIKSFKKIAIEELLNNNVNNPKEYLEKEIKLTRLINSFGNEINKDLE